MFNLISSWTGLWDDAKANRKTLLSNVVQMLSNDEAMRAERSDAAVAMLETKMQLLQLQQKLTQPILRGIDGGGVDGPAAEELMNGGGPVTRALYTLTKRMLDAQSAWEMKKQRIEEARADDFAAVLTSLTHLLSAAQETDGARGPPVQRAEFLHRHHIFCE